MRPVFKKRRAGQGNSLVFEELEPRLLFSADVAEGLAPGAIQEQTLDEPPPIVADQNSDKTEHAAADSPPSTTSQEQDNSAPKKDSTDKPTENGDTDSANEENTESSEQETSKTEEEKDDSGEESSSSPETENDSETNENKEPEEQTLSTTENENEENKTDLVDQSVPDTELVSADLEEESTGEQSVTSATEVVFVNDNIYEHEQLVEDLLQNADDDHTIEVVILDDTEDGIDQISEVLQEYDRLDAVHFITYGNDNGVQLGRNWHDSTSMLANREAIAGWGDALTEDGDILFYGCDIAADSDGERLVETIADLTGADVAASTDLTGNADLGGDWDLEYQTGTVETSTIINPQLNLKWAGVLDTTSGLVAHWRFDEGNGTTATDSSTNSNDGTLTDEPTYTSGHVGSHALDFNGDYDRVVVPDKASLDFGSDDFSVSLWFNSSQTEDEFHLLVGDYDEANSVGFAVYSHTGSLVFYIGDGTNDFEFSVNGAFDGNWHHVVGVRDDNTALLYVDDTLYNPDSDDNEHNVGNINSPNTLNIGAYSDTKFDFDGLMDDVRVYNRALTAADITELYNNEAPVITSNGGGATAAITVSENQTAVTTVTATDADGDTPTFSINGGADAALFDIDANSGELIFNNAPDYENPGDANNDNVYEVTVQANDDQSGIDTQNISVTVTDVANTLTVTTTSDAGGGDTSSIEALNADKGADGEISLREAIIAANNTSGTDTISFDIAGDGPHTIDVTSALPGISDTIVIDGTTEPDFNNTPTIEINGENAGSANGLVLQGGSAGSTIRGLVINRFKQNGITIYSDNNTVAGNYIGTDTTGTADRGNTRYGIAIAGGDGNMIGGSSALDRNIISGNEQHGIELGSNSESNKVQGNFIGTNADGTGALGNTYNGILINGAGNNIIGTDLDGVSDGSEGNLISGNSQHGIGFYGSNATNNLIAGNKIGVDNLAANALGNQHHGISINGGSHHNIIGGGSIEARNIISGNEQVGINIGGDGSEFNKIQGNYIGTDDSGTVDLGNTNGGISLYSDNTIIGTDLDGTDDAAEGNLISGNDGDGIYIGSDGENNRIQGNYIGTDKTGTNDLGNTNGIKIVGDTNLIGGAAVAARNIISGNSVEGIYIGSGGNNNKIQGNYIGTDADGTGDLGNTGRGIVISRGSGNIIGTDLDGTDDADEGNLISGNDNDGIELWGAATTGNAIRGNLIGVNVTASSILANGNHGIHIGGGASDNVVGGIDGNTSNIIGGNRSSGIALGGADTSGNIIQGNFIGTDSSGTANFNNYSGITLWGGAVDNIIGGSATGAGNTIAFNRHNGITILGDTTVNNALLGNSIYNNAHLGIDLANDGTTQNDTGDGDTGANNLQNYPVLLSAITNNSDNITLQGFLSTNTANQDFRLEFFSSTVEDADHHGEGETFLGHADVTTDANGNITFTENIPDFAIPVGAFISATATVSLGGGNYGDTSEFAKNTAAVSAFIDLDDDDSSGQTGSDFSTTFTEDGGPVAIIGAADAIVTHAEGTDFQSMTVTITNLLDGADEALSADVNGTSIAASYDNTTGILTLSGADTPVNYQQVLRTITYNNTSQNPDTTSRSITFVANDGSNDSNTATTTLGITSVNDAPLIANIATSVAEDSSDNTIISNINDTNTGNDTDIEGEALNYSITAGNTDGIFAINAGTGEITISDNSNLDYESTQQYILTVEASDGIDTDTADVTIDVTDVVEAASFTIDAIANAPVTENAAFTSVTPDLSGDAPIGNVTYTIAGADAALFTVDAGTGVVSMIARDYENPVDANTDNIYEVTLIATDDDGNTDDEIFTVTVTDDNDSAVGLVTDSDDAVNTVTESANIGDTVGVTAQASDSDGTDTVTYSLSDDAGGLFSIDANTGVITVANALDYETATSHSVTVVAASSDTSTSNATFTINITDTNDAPVLAAIGNQTVDELATLSFSATATDSDLPADTLTYSLDATSLAAGMTIDANTGVFAWTPTEGQVGTAPSVTITVTDNGTGNLIDSETFTITVTDVNDTPVDNGDETTSIPDQIPPAVDETESEETIEKNIEETTILPVTHYEKITLPNQEPPSETYTELDDKPTEDKEKKINQDSTSTDSPIVTNHLKTRPLNPITANPIDQPSAAALIFTSKMSHSAGSSSTASTSKAPFAEKAVVLPEEIAEIPEESIVELPDSEEITERLFRKNKAIRTQLDQVRREMDEAFDETSKKQELIASAIKSTSISFAAGGAGYLLRGGSLLSSFLSTVPLWKSFDPVGILTAPTKREKKERNNVQNMDDIASRRTDNSPEQMFTD